LFEYLECHARELVRQQSVVGNTLATIPSFLSPLVVAHIIEGSQDGWPGIFSMLACTTVGTVLLYLLTLGVGVVDEEDNGAKNKSD
jgi:hypothetical protein